MKRHSYLPYILLALILVSCGTASDHFKIEGRFLNLNQGEFYVYSTDGGVEGIDTIKVEGGRFTYEKACTRPSTLMLVFPNFSEQPIFAEPGKSVEVKADASHLKEMTVEGTKANELMTEFREMILNSSPPQTKKLAEQFITDHPESPVSVYLVTRYFIQTAEPDYKKAQTLIAAIRKEQPDNGTLARLANAAESLGKIRISSPLPAFKATDVNGRTVTEADLKTGVGVISVWASWSFDSQKMQRTLYRIQRSKGNRLKIVSVCVDASQKDCIRNIKRDSISWPNICDGQLFESPVMRRLGLNTVPDNVVLRDGRVIARGLTVEEMEKKLKDI